MEEHKRANAAALPTRREYPGLDAFRILAAFLVVAIHTAPLASVNTTADFLLTRVVARLAVPFFFMASGFFMAKAKRQNPFRHFAAKTAKLYALCILLYLPLNLYMGTYTGRGAFGRALADVLWNGTVYHLWYFPAVLLGGCIAWFLCRRLQPVAALSVGALLYLVGLGGDSYYGAAACLPTAKAAYDGFFSVVEYTRGGLFFAPLFMLLGLYMARGMGKQLGAKPAALGFVASLTLMAAEALTLRGLGAMRHDSMYLLLPVCAFFLFALLQKGRGKGHARLRSLSALVFVLHPGAIVFVRAVAKLGRLPQLVEAGPLFYACVCAASVAAALVCMRLARTALPFAGRVFRRKSAAAKTSAEKAAPAGRAAAYLDEGALLHNLGQVRTLLPAGCRVMAVVKDDAYGHGAAWVAKKLQKSKVKAFAVATMEEGVHLRRHGVRGVILVLGYTQPRFARKLRFWRLTQTAVDLAHARALAREGVGLRVHLKVDPGMHRLGIPAADVAACREVYALAGLRVTGLYTHLARAASRQEEDEHFTRRQIDAYYHLLEQLAANGVQVGETHLQGSYGLLNWPGLPCSYVRCGLALYGVRENAADRVRAKVALCPVMRLTALVASVRTVPAGQWVGYGRSHRCKKDTRIATVTLGYGDGYPRSVKGGFVLLRGTWAPVVGRPCMDQLCVCVDHIPAATAGDRVVIIGADGPWQLRAEDLAAQSGTIGNEIVARIGSRVAKKPLPRRAAAAETVWAGRTIPFSAEVGAHNSSLAILP